MIMDRKNTVSNAQAVTATAFSTDVIDLGPLSSGNAGRDMGVSEEQIMSITCTETATAAGAATVTFEIVTDDNSSLSSPTVLFASAAIGKATLVAGYVLNVRMPVSGYERFVGVRYTVATGPLTAGKFTAGIVMDPGFYRAYAVGSTNGVS